MSSFLIGAYLIAVGITGNAGGLLEALASDGAFIPFAIAISIGYFAWEETPPPEQKPVRVLITVLIIGIVISQYSRLLSALSTAWSTVTNLNGGTITNSDTTPNTSGSANGVNLGGNPSGTTYNGNYGVLPSGSYGNTTDPLGGLTNDNPLQSYVDGVGTGTNPDDYLNGLANDDPLSSYVGSVGSGANPDTDYLGATTGNTGINSNAAIGYGTTQGVPSSTNLGSAKALPLISKYESGGANVYNYKFTTNPTKYSASGFYQITNTTWQANAGAAGVDTTQYPTAISAPKSVQQSVATAIYNKYGLRPWQTNTRLMTAVSNQS